MKINSRLLRRSIGARTFVLSVIVSVLGATMLGGGLVLSTSASSPQAYNNIQIFIKTVNSSLDSYQVSVYNSTDGLVASTQSQYPVSSFELPTGTYLFAVSATSSYSYRYGGGPIVYSQSSGSSSAMPICRCYSYPTEYGYILTTATSSKTINVTTTPIENMATSIVTITAKYANGTAAAGASVPASVVGGYYWYYANQKIAMYNTTGSDGVATLIVPSVPIEVTAWSWVPANLPKNETTTQVIIGGETVNVTVYWQPMYVGLAGSALIIPPTASARITMEAQQPNYWAVPYGVQTAQAGVASPQTFGAPSYSSGAVGNGPGSVPAGVAQQQNSQQFLAQSRQTTQDVQTQISPLPSDTTTQTVTRTATTTLSGSSSLGSIVLEAGVALAIIIGSAGVVLAVRRK